MNKELPNIFANSIDKEIKNVQETYFGNNRDGNSVLEVLDRLNDSSKYIFRKSVEIVTNSGRSIEKIALMTREYLLTLSNKKINIKDIKSIKEI